MSARAAQHGPLANGHELRVSMSDSYALLLLYDTGWPKRLHPFNNSFPVSIHFILIYVNFTFMLWECSLRIKMTSLWHILEAKGKEGGKGRGGMLVPHFLVESYALLLDAYIRTGMGR